MTDVTTSQRRSGSKHGLQRVGSGLVVGFLTGMLLVSGAWAGVVVAPAPQQAGAVEFPEPVAGERLPDGWFLAGSAKVSISPDPDIWTPDDPVGTCGSVPAHTPVTDVDGCLLTFDKLWATHVDDYGIHVRAMALSNGQDTVAIAVMDTISWFYGYPDHICGDCGAKAIGEAVAAASEGAITPEGIVVASSHTHASGDTTSTMPTWYYEQIRDATIEALLEAIDDLRPAMVETGAIAAKQLNTDRRHVTRAIPDYELAWFRAFVPGEDGTAEETVTTVVNFAVHSTILAANDFLHDGLVGPMAELLEDKWGGTAMFLPGGLGDQRVQRGFGRDGIGGGLAELVLEDEARGAYRLQTNDIAIDRTELEVALDNQLMAGLLAADYFVRDVLPPYGGGPMTAVAQRGGAARPSCVSSGAQHVVVPVGGFKIGERGGERGDRGDALVIMQAPGEIFSSISLVTKDYLSRTRNVLVAGMANDHIGYIIPAQQFDLTAQQGIGLVGGMEQATDYEEALSMGRCAGDQIQNALLESGERLGVMGRGESP